MIIFERCEWRGEYAPVFLLPGSVQNVEQCDLVINDALLAV